MNSRIVAKAIQRASTLVFLASIMVVLFMPQSVEAQTSVPTCKAGVHMISPSDEDFVEAAELINSNGGDYCWMTLVFREDELTADNLQRINDIARKNRFQIVYRLEKGFDSKGNWYPLDKQTIQAFIDSMSHIIPSQQDIPVVLGNEPTHDAMRGDIEIVEFASRTLEGIRMLHDVENDIGVNFLVGMAGHDLASPQSPGTGYYDAGYFMDEMFKAEPDLLCEVDIWVSHSYPRNFVGSAGSIGRLSPRGYEWELSFIQDKARSDCKDHVQNLPVYITETGYRVGVGGIDNAIAQSNIANLIDVYQSDPRVHMFTLFAYRYCGEPFQSFALAGCDVTSLNGAGQALLLARKTDGDVRHIHKARTRVECPEEIVENTEVKCTISAENLGTDIWKDIGGEYGFTLLGVDHIDGDKEHPDNPKYVFSRFRDIEPTKDLDGTLRYNPGKVLGTHKLTIGLSRKGNLILGLATIELITYKTPTLDLRVKGFFGGNVNQESVQVQVFDSDDNVTFRTKTSVIDGVADIGEVTGVQFGSCYRVVLLIDGSLPVQHDCIHFEKGHNSVEMPRLLSVDKNNDGALSFDDIRGN